MSGNVANVMSEEEQDIREREISIARRHAEVKAVGKLEWDILSLERMALKEKTGLIRMVIYDDLLDTIHNLREDIASLYNSNIDLLIAREEMNNIIEDLII